MRIFDFSVPQGQVREVIAKGSFVMYLDGSGGLDGAMSLRVPGQGEVVMLPGQSLRLPVDSSRFLVVGDREAATVSGRLIIGEGSFEDRRLFGAVQASQAGRWLSSGEQSLFAEREFIGFGSMTVPALSGTDPWFISINADPDQVMLRRATVWCDQACEFALCLDGTNSGSTSFIYARNKRNDSGNPASVATLRHGRGPAPVPAAAWRVRRVNIAAGAEWDWSPATPIVRTGFMLLFEDTGIPVGANVRFTLEWADL